MALYYTWQFIRDCFNVYIENDFFIYLIVVWLILMSFKIIWSLLNWGKYK